MVSYTVCDIDNCTRVAEFRVEFHRLRGPKMPDGDTSADQPTDLCKIHYDKVWEFINV